MEPSSLSSEMSHLESHPNAWNLAGRRILIVSENESVPGDRRVWDIATTLAASGGEVVVVCPQDGRDSASHEVRDGVEIHRYRARFAAGGALSYVREYARAMICTWRLVSRLSRERPFDVVHSCAPPDFLVFSAWPARRRGARLIFDHHDLTPELFASRFGEGHRLLYRLTVLLERLSLRAADVAIATNEAYAGVQTTRAGKRADDVFVVRNAPDLSRLKEVAPDPSLARGKRFLIGYLGVMSEQDGVDVALEALRGLRERRDDWHAIFAGDGPSIDTLKQLTRELALDDVVEFAGWIGDGEIARLLSTADVCLSPEPKTAFNDMSTLVKITEYMAMGRPLVAFPLQQTQFTAQDAAVYADANDPVSYACCIDALLNDPLQRARMGQIGRDRVRRSFTWEQSKRPLQAAYDRALELQLLPTETRPPGDRLSVLAAPETATDADMR
jgi:glycosyltransferase involved in cell wall biosynthesis